MFKVRGFFFVIVFVAAAAAAKSCQSCPTLCDLIDGSPPGSSVPGILQGRIWEWAAFPSCFEYSTNTFSLKEIYGFKMLVGVLTVC